jgi:Ran GTPase-activating protein (RanGAP) involved in mRNA processing and transport
MQRNQLTDACLATLCKGLQFNESITMLDLAHNSMAHEAFSVLGEVLPFNSVLKELRLSWNNCHGRGLRSLSKGLLTNKSVKRLDLSWNLLSRERQDLTACSMLDDDAEAAIAVFASLIRKNRGLRHLDISNCSLSPRHASLVADAFNNNHSITGFHYDGNTGLLDPKVQSPQSRCEPRPYRLLAHREQTTGGVRWWAGG